MILIQLHLFLSLNSGCATNSLRLVGGTNALTGRLEICNNNVWGTICDDSFGANDALVACRQLGYAGMSFQKGMLNPLDQLDFSTGHYFYYFASQEILS